MMLGTRIGLARAMNTAVIGAFALCLVAFAASAAPGKPKKDGVRPDTTSETYGSWVFRCGPAGKKCYLLQSLVRKKNRVLVARVTIFAPGKKNGKLMLRVLLPLGVGLAKGTRVSVDKAKPRKVPYLFCSRRGCVVELTVPSLLDRRLRVGRTLTVTAFSVDGARSLPFRFSLKGLTRAIRRQRSK